MADRAEKEHPRTVAAAKALWERDAKRSVGLGGAKQWWPRVQGEYLAAAKVALEAADAASEPETEALFDA